MSKSAFTRRAPASAPPPPSGTRVSAYTGSLLVSTGVASFDEVLGGGLPVGSLLLLEQDEHSSYADLVQKLFVSQGLSSPGHHVAVLSSRLEDGGGPEAFLAKLPAKEDASVSQSGLEQAASSPRDPMKIAFRYEALKAVDAPKLQKPSATEQAYCSTFDMTQYMPAASIDRARTHAIDVTPQLRSPVPLHEHLSELTHIVETKGFMSTSAPNGPRGILRIALHSFASSAWGEHSSAELNRFLLGLRHLSRGSLSCAVATIRPSLLDPVLVRRLEHAADCVISLQSFAGRADLAEMFPRYAGLVHVKTLPALESLVPPSTRLSVLRGTSGKDDLAFRLKRRRFVVETLHLDIEGGVSERKTPKKDDLPAKDSSAKTAFKADQPKLYDF